MKLDSSGIEGGVKIEIIFCKVSINLHCSFNKVYDIMKVNGKQHNIINLTNNYITNTSLTLFLMIHEVSFPYRYCQ